MSQAHSYVDLYQEARDRINLKNMRRLKTNFNDLVMSGAINPPKKCNPYIKFLQI